ncbi:MAG: hypothetical protein CMJ65_07715 [Planctomycetaceae bacterium]|jgi:hypothetical protein|nr:hypothetical protein [Planctomycetaceae bacterium]MDP7277062.1 FHA domain-containing protein [Planctomycetaceae bacterium]
MSEPATITVTRGPARGQLFELDQELVHIGRAESNQVVLSDPELAEHQASIARRNGRFAIFTPLPDAVSVNGNRIPPQRWVWLPGEAEIELGDRTSFRFSTAAAGSTNGDTDTQATEAARETGDDEKETGRARRKKRPRKRKRQLARFVNDGSGDARVQLGEDGHLPELTLDEEMTGGRPDKRSRGSSNLLLYLLLAGSVAASSMLILVDGPASSTSARATRNALSELKQILLDSKQPAGAESDWQILVRDALAARARRNRNTERRAYDRLLKLLNAEDLGRTGLTGDLGQDKRLRELIAELIGP